MSEMVENACSMQALSLHLLQYPYNCFHLE